ncbi:RNA-directed DNA polymerase, eukaryota [Tanacetum coccineum]
MVRFIKKLQILKKEIRSWAAATKLSHSVMATDIKAKLKAIDITLDQGGVFDDVLLSRMDLMKQLQDIKSSDVRDQLQKAKLNGFSPIVLLLEGVVTKILALRLSLVISDLISDVQTVFLPNRQILNGPFILNELLSWCKFKKQQTLVFKVDFAKAYDSIRWDYLDDVLAAFGFGSKWRSWIKGSLSNGMASILVNGSPTAEFQFFRGLKQGDPLAPYLFILVMESFHLSISRAIEAGFFTGIKVDRSLTLSHLFYADDAVFIGEWSTDNLRNIMQMLHCFSLSSGMVINLKKSQLLGIGVHCATISNAASSIGCAVLKPPFKYLGVMVGGNMSRVNAWEDSIGKIKARLSKWKLKTLSVGGRLTLLKSVLGSTPIYSMSLYKVPKTVLNEMESLRRNFFNGVNGVDRKIAWVQWAKVLASKKYGGLGVSSFFALNRALLFKWVWRFISQENTLWFRFISALHGKNIQKPSFLQSSIWNTIIKEVNVLKLQGVDLLSFCKIRVGSGTRTKFWEDKWIGDSHLGVLFPRLYALENNKECSVAEKIQGSLLGSFRRLVRGGVESQQLEHLRVLLVKFYCSSVMIVGFVSLLPVCNKVQEDVLILSFYVTWLETSLVSSVVGGMSLGRLPHKPVSSSLNGKNKNSVQGHSFPGHRTSNGSTGSYANVVNGVPSSANPGSVISPSLALVLDENCLVERDFSKYAMGRVKDVHSISNILSILHDEGLLSKFILRAEGVVVPNVGAKPWREKSSRRITPWLEPRVLAP